MKKFLVLLALAAFTSATYAQVIDETTHQIQVPSAIITSFSTGYPSVEHPVWRKTGTYYIVDYTQNNNPMYVKYDANGNVIETGEGVAASAYPPALTTYVQTKYKNDHIEKVYKVKDAKGKTLWKGQVKQDYLFFDENGNYIKMEKD